MAWGREGLTPEAAPSGEASGRKGTHADGRRRLWGCRLENGVQRDVTRLPGRLSNQGVSIPTGGLECKLRARGVLEFLAEILF